MYSIKYYFLLLFIHLLLSSCQQKHNPEKEKQIIQIDIQPFIGIPNKEVIYVKNELIKIYPKVFVKQPIKLPSTAFYAERNRYKADSLLTFLNTATADLHIRPLS